MQTEPLTRLEMLRRVRQLCALLEADETIQMPFEFTDAARLSIFCHQPETWHSTVRALGGGTKDADNDTLQFFPECFPFLKVYGFKNQICERVVVGKREVPEIVIPAKAKTVIPAHEEEIIEWQCKPFTAPVEPSSEQIDAAIAEVNF